MKFATKLLFTALICFVAFGRMAEAGGKLPSFKLSASDNEQDGAMLYPFICNTVADQLQKLKSVEPKDLERIIQYGRDSSKPYDEVWETRLARLVHASVRLKEYSKVLSKEQLNQDGLFIKYPNINAEYVHSLINMAESVLKGYSIPHEKVEQLIELDIKESASLAKDSGSVLK